MKKLIKLNAVTQGTGDVKGIEGFMVEFLEWYSPFLKGVKRFKIKEKGSKANTSFDSVDEPVYGVHAGCADYFHVGKPQSKIFMRGNYAPLLKKESELEEKVSELNEKFGLEGKAYFININYGGCGVGPDEKTGKQKTTYYPSSSPYYAIFLTGIEFKLNDRTNVLCRFIYDDKQEDSLHQLKNQLYVSFDPGPYISRKIKENSEGRQIISSGGGKLMVNRYSGNGGYSFNNVRLFSFEININPGDAYMTYLLRFTEKSLGTGALNAFMEIAKSEHFNPAK